MVLWNTVGEKEESTLEDAKKPLHSKDTSSWLPPFQKIKVLGLISVI